MTLGRSLQHLRTSPAIAWVKPANASHEPWKTVKKSITGPGIERLRKPNLRMQPSISTLTQPSLLASASALSWAIGLPPNLTAMAGEPLWSNSTQRVQIGALGETNSFKGQAFVHRMAQLETRPQRLLMMGPVGPVRID
jgi:hypothetical protein